MSKDKTKSSGIDADKPVLETTSREEINRAFAFTEFWGARIGFWLIMIGLGVYTTGMIRPLLEIEKLIQYWGLPADQFLQATGMPVGWEWIGKLGHSDMLGLLGLVILSSAVIFAYLSIIPALVRAKDRVYLLLVVLQLGVFVLAAGGWLTGGH